MTPARAASTVIGDVGQRPVRAFRVLAIDPGPVESAYVVFDGERVLYAKKQDNESLLFSLCILPASALVIEQIAAMGMAVGAETFETVFWSGRFVQMWQTHRGPMRAGNWSRIKRHEVKTHLCNSMRAKDANIRQALIDRFGGKEMAIGKKKAPGPLYGIAGDCWSALAVAVTWWDLHYARARGLDGVEGEG